jgi:N-methylhydantoinase A
VTARRVRIGVDVGGTFTHAVAVDVETSSLVCAVKVPTTHTSAEGVGTGIIQSLRDLCADGKFQTSDVSLIAHSTTQATNALLEGDAAAVGILSMGSGALGFRARSQSAVAPLPLAPGRQLEIFHAYLECAGEPGEEELTEAFRRLAKAGAQVLVITRAFGVDDPGVEERAAALATRLGYSATAASALSGTYGLRLRTRTACVNGAILPRMTQAAVMTRQSVNTLWEGHAPPLMVMRSDGGIMSVEDMEARPVLTILSGPAAGVAAALRFSGIADGIFLEVGGTSTDICVIRDGRARLRSASVGGHTLGLRTLDVRTVSVAGGSLSRPGESWGVGPRSAHIAGVTYACYVPNIVAEQVRGVKQDKDPNLSGYWCFLHGDDPRVMAITPTCAASLLGFIPEGHEARGHPESVRQALLALAGPGEKPEDMARRVLEAGSRTITQTVNALIEEYQLDRGLTVLVGGGGGAHSWVPFVAQQLGLRHQIVEHASVISAIGCAMALLRETAERSILTPTEADLLALRREVADRLAAAGAARPTITVEVDFDPRRGVLRAVGTGATEMTRAAGAPLPVAERAVRAAADHPDHHANFLAATTALWLYRIDPTGSPGTLLRLVDPTGAIRWQRRRGAYLATTAGAIGTELPEFLEHHSRFGDAGRELPETFLVHGEQLVNLTGLVDPARVMTLIRAELEGLPALTPALILVAE